MNKLVTGTILRRNGFSSWKMAPPGGRAPLGGKLLAGALLEAFTPAWGPGACPGGKLPGWGPAWGFLGPGQGPWNGNPQTGTLWGQITWLAPCLGLWRLLGALGPGQGPLGMATPRGGAGRASKTLGFRFTFVCSLHQVWLLNALPWQGRKRPNFSWAYA